MLKRRQKLIAELGSDAQHLEIIAPWLRIAASFAQAYALSEQEGRLGEASERFVDSVRALIALVRAALDLEADASSAHFDWLGRVVEALASDLQGDASPGSDGSAFGQAIMNAPPHGPTESKASRWLVLTRVLIKDLAWWVAATQGASFPEHDALLRSATNDLTELVKAWSPDLGSDAKRRLLRLSLAAQLFLKNVPELAGYLWESQDQVAEGVEMDMIPDQSTRALMRELTRLYDRIKSEFPESARRRALYIDDDSRILLVDFLLEAVTYLVQELDRHGDIDEGCTGAFVDHYIRKGVDQFRKNQPSVTAQLLAHIWVDEVAPDDAPLTDRLKVLRGAKTRAAGTVFGDLLWIWDLVAFDVLVLGEFDSRLKPDTHDHWVELRCTSDEEEEGEDDTNEEPDLPPLIEIVGCPPPMFSWRDGLGPFLRVVQLRTARLLGDMVPDDEWVDALLELEHEGAVTLPEWAIESRPGVARRARSCVDAFSLRALAAACSSRSWRGLRAQHD